VPGLTRAWAAALLACPLACCDQTYPEVAVVNRTEDHLLVRNLSFSGCAWPDTLALGEVTPPCRCLPGEDRVHFERFNGASYVAQQTQDAGAVGDGGRPWDGEPTWFAYQTRVSYRVDHGDRRVIELTLEDMEQDFAVPGPYGH
jgi:hypothetical protein